jgi:flagellar motor component MotA
VAARRGLIEDLLELEMRLSWRRCLFAAAVSAAVLQGSAAVLSGSGVSATVLGLVAFATRNLTGTIVRMLGVVIPLALVFAAVGSRLRQRQV